MTLRHFRIFIAVCETMNMTSAAEGLYMSQSAVSQAIAELESHYEVRLFERLSKKLYLTHAGQKLLGYAYQIKRMNAEVENDMKALKSNSCIRVGASVTVGAYVLPRVASDFKRANPLTEVEVFEDNTEKIENMLLHDQVDLGLVEGETVSPDIINQTFMDDELVIICSNKHKFAGRPSIEPYELEQEKFIIREKGSGTRKTFEDMMTSNRLSWKAVWTCNNSDTIKLAVAEGLGISAISRLSVRSEVASGLLCQTTVNGIQFKRQFKIIYHKNKYLTEEIRKFFEGCRSVNLAVL